jgi:cytosine/adenosine deaminase-related metal-dependent hydrolase
VHAAEGVDADAAREIEELNRLGCLTSKTVVVHGVALTPRAADLLIACGGSLVWCPTSNQFLFGATADVRKFDAAGKLALGTDSRISGEGDLLDELRAAHAARQVPVRSLLRAVTEGAARVLRLRDAGRLAAGKPADLTILKRTATDPLDSLVSARRTDLELTMIGGRPLVSAPRLSAVFERPDGSRPVRVDGVPKLLARSIANRMMKSSEVESGLEVLP